MLSDCTVQWPRLAVFLKMWRKTLGKAYISVYCLNRDNKLRIRSISLVSQKYSFIMSYVRRCETIWHWKQLKFNKSGSLEPLAHHMLLLSSYLYNVRLECEGIVVRVAARMLRPIWNIATSFTACSLFLVSSLCGFSHQENLASSPRARGNPKRERKIPFDQNI